MSLLLRATRCSVAFYNFLSIISQSYDLYFKQQRKTFRFFMILQKIFADLFHKHEINRQNKENYGYKMVPLE